TWVACDNWSQSPSFGNCYAEVDDDVHNDTIKMFTSSNGGKSWTEATVALASGLGGQPLAQPNGNVVVPYSVNFGGIAAVVSTDGGKTYKGPYTISNTTDHNVSQIRTPPLPTAEVDKSGKVYVAWQD